MACACKVNQELSYIQKKYGVKGPSSKKTDISFRVKVFFANALGYMVSFLLSPIMLLMILFNKGKVINVGKLFGLSAK